MFPIFYYYLVNILVRNRSFVRCGSYIIVWNISPTYIHNHITQCCYTFGFYWYNSENVKGKGKPFVCTIFLLALFFFHSWCSKVGFFLWSFPLFPLCEPGWQQILLVFIKISWFPLHSWRIFLPSMGFWVDSSFHTWK